MDTTEPASWVDRYADYLFSYALLKTGSREVAEDLVQDTFLSAFNGREQFRGDSTEKTWLTRILKNKIADHFRKKRPEQPLDDYLRATDTAFDRSFFTTDGYGTWKDDITGNYFSNAPDADLFSKDFQKFLRICLMLLPERLRSVFVARFIEEEKTETICKEFNLTASNYWVLVFRAKTLMRACLEKKGVV
jgi:RNA polymerase sigma-70 factor (TIGR02943 family)